MHLPVLQGLLTLLGGTPGTLVLGGLQAVLPVAVVDVLAWVMVAWINVLFVFHWIASRTLGMGWLGLVLPQAAAVVSVQVIQARVGHCVQTL
jgi:hypothetical protein